MPGLGYLPKLKRGLGLAFGAHFVPFLILYLWKNFQCRTFFPSQDHPVKQWPTGRKRGEDGNTKI